MDTFSSLSNFPLGPFISATQVSEDKILAGVMQEYSCPPSVYSYTDVMQSSLTKMKGDAPLALLEFLETVWFLSAREFIDALNTFCDASIDLMPIFITGKIDTHPCDPEELGLHGLPCLMDGLHPMPWQIIFSRWRLKINR